jgi:hypothetical protein
MNSVSLVCTVHENAGLANASVLLSILERIQPEVVFVELPPEAFEDFYGSCSQYNLESMAVRQYREGRRVKPVAVDLPRPSGNFASNIEELDRRVRRVSPEYRRLMQLDDDRIRKYGFAYLNSEDCREHWERAYEDMVSSIKWMNDSRLLALYESCRETDDLREKAMMENIQIYCRANAFDKGVFLVGAAHRQPIIEKSRKQTAPGTTRIEWDFTNWMREVPPASGA